NARLQLQALTVDQQGKTIDLTRRVAYQVHPAGSLLVDSQGRVTPQKNGPVTVTVTSGNMTATAEINVKNFDSPPRLNFFNNIVPIFTKFGCNAGGCHGKSGGQNGFSLSLLGFGLLQRTGAV
ncbi:hypothetical protein OAF34_04140, partial [Pirellulaceae bacterium]|nr:hypothetical protein [Pirellulaceae bacterium]